MSEHDAFAGVLLGTAAGDSIGLPREGLSARRAGRLFGNPPLRQQLLLGRGMVSDDTEHAVLTAQALLDCQGVAADFGLCLARRLRRWFAGLPAGVGLATLRACLKLCVGISPARSGVRSAGNGPAMRAPILGVYLARRPSELRTLVSIATRITHIDERAEEGAYAIALAAAHGAQGGRDAVTSPQTCLASLLEQLRGAELRGLICAAQAHLARGSSVPEFAAAMGWNAGVSGYINHTVPAALYAWLRHPDSFRDAVEASISCGGDADTVGAIVGGLSGATLGPQAIPDEWLQRLIEFPRGLSWMRQLSAALARSASGDLSARPPSSLWPALLLRQPLFIATVLTHGFRRLLPPY